jgi:hypothetical protein
MPDVAASARSESHRPRRLRGHRLWSHFRRLGAACLGLASLAVDGLPADSDPAPAEAPLVARAGDRSVVLHWRASGRPAGFNVFRQAGDGSRVRLTAKPLRVPRFADLAVTNGVTYRYVVTGGPGGPLAVEATPRPFASDAEFLELLQATAFDYFWREANPANGLVKDRSTTNSFCSIAATGFGLTALGIGIDHGWITREAGRQRALTTLKTFREGPQGDAPAGVIGHRGWFYHFLDMQTATRFKRVELSSIDTALFLAGALDVREYFDGEHPDERAIRELADALVDRVDWRWMADGGDTLTMGWHPESGFLQSRWVGYNEAMILYLLALGARHGALGPEFWQGWTRGYRWATYYGQSYIEFAPLFGHQYSHGWVDFRGLADAFLRGRGMDYFENSRRATLANRAYCVANPKGWRGYGPDCWGLTACDGPGFAPYHAYRARGAPPPENDDGTIAPTAAGGSLPFAPEVCLPALRHFYDAHRERLWTPFGFRDAFNLTADWWDPDVLGIDQGPILIMAENHRAGRVWRRFMKNEIIRRGLERAGFTRIGNER